MRARLLAPPRLRFVDRLCFALYVAMHLALSPWLALSGLRRRVRRDYARSLGRRFWGDPRAATTDLDILIVTGAMGETRTGVRAARELQALGYRVGVVPSLEGSLRSIETEPNLPTGIAPFNAPHSSWLFLRAWRPMAIWFVEGNDLPYLAYLANRGGIPCHVVNGYFTEANAARARSRAASRWRLLCLAGWGLQTEDAKERLISLGIEARRCVVTGPSIGISLPDQATRDGLRAKWRALIGLPAGGRLIVAGSTYPEEETILVEAFLKLGDPGARLLLAPRVLFRPESLAGACEQLGVAYALRSRLPNPEAARVIVLDTLGELRELYALADVAHLGGTLVEGIGGHTPVEAIVYGVPFTFGPWHAQQVAMVELAVAAGLAFPCRTVDDLAAQWGRLLVEPDPTRLERARALVGRQGRAFADYWGPK
ncbi:MAG: hypothetical protein KIS66_10445 [Fimbriimonadaceae bacterium]|nr:hypothetical protein [Fimbriimonadaceae bacterium]